MKFGLQFCVFSFCSSERLVEYPGQDSTPYLLENKKWNTSKSSALASLTASARIALTSSGVNVVPPPRGKSTSSVGREFVMAFVLNFFAFLVEEDSSRGRFWAGIDAMSSVGD